MREIKFRGKRKDNGEWAYGFLVTDRIAQIGGMGRKAFIVSRWDNPFVEWIEIDPETVGQYTGLHDKNGKEIYEGDVVRTSGWQNFIVDYWDCGWGAYVLTPDGRGYEAQLGDYSDIEVIGNIHEGVTE